MPVRFHPHNPIDALENIILKDDGSPLHGEIDMYRKLFTDLSQSKEDWNVWHDIKLPTHSDNFNYYKKTSAQIDFIILCKLGIIVLEVKGGFISFKDNIFYYGRNFESEMKQNPFRQAEGYKHTLKDHILNNVKGCFFCDAVALPHVNYAFNSRLIDQKLLWTEFNATNYNNSIETFIKSVFDNTKEKHRKHFRTYKELSSKEIQSIIKILSPIVNDDNIYHSISTADWLNINNLEILDGLYKNPRIMIEGPPGSGKTTIAKGYIDKQIGKKGLYLCWNNLLMHYIEKVLSQRITFGEIEVTTLPGLLLKYNKEISYEDVISFSEEDFYQALKDTIEKGNISNHYDYIVIDEGQDVFDRGIDLLINEFCGYKGNGLNNGNALILYDIDQSYLSSGRNVMELSDILSEYFSHFKLNEVRRSLQIPEVRDLSIDVLDDPRTILGDDFQTHYPNIIVFKHKNLEAVKRHIVAKVLSSIRSQKSSLKGEDCVLLIESTLLKGVYKGGPDMSYELTMKDVEELNKDNIGDSANKLWYTSILKFKGLEKKHVFLVVSEPSDLNKYELFVGITRAISSLEINIVME